MFRFEAQLSLAFLEKSHHETWKQKQLYPVNSKERGNFLKVPSEWRRCQITWDAESRPKPCFESKNTLENPPHETVKLESKTERKKSEKREKLLIPRPLEATSVAIMIGLLPDLNSPSTQSLSCCCLSPWIARAGHPSWRRYFVKSSAVRLVPTKIKTLAFSWEIFSRCLINLMEQIIRKKSA